MLVSVMQAASPLAPSDKYPQNIQQGQNPSHFSNKQSYPQHHQSNRISQNSLVEDEDINPNTTIIMTGNGFFVTSSSGIGQNGSVGNSGLMKSKSGSMPDRYSGRGFRDTFVSSMTPPAGSYGSQPHHSHSATSSPHHQMMSPNNRNDFMNSPNKESSNISKDSGGGGGSESSKKWTFGGLFKRKSKNASNGNSHSPNLVGGSMGGTSSPISGGSMSMSLSSPSPAPSSIQNSGNVSTQPYPRIDGNPHGVATVAKGISRNNSNNIISTTPTNSAGGGASSGGNKYVSTPTQTRHRGKLSESDLSSEDSEPENDSWAQQNQQPVSFKQNFLTRRLSRRREKAAAKKKAMDDQKQIQAQNGLLKVPAGNGSGQLNNGKRVGSSPESLNNNGNNIFGFGTNGPWPSWEITKKVPQLQAANNYSSSGSLSLSLEGSTKGSRAALKEAVKARAVARRESFFHDSSSEDDGEDRSRSSIQGSHSSLSSRNRRRPYVVNASSSGGGGNNSYPYPPQQGQTFRPSEFARGSPSSPARFDYKNNNPSPNFNRKPIAPGSPRWEARVIYQQENVENDTPFVVKLPKNTSNLNNGNQGQVQPQISNIPGTPGYIMTNESNSEDQQQHVITAGLRVPISGHIQNGQYITEEVHYANLPNNGNNANHNMMRQRSATPQNYPNGYNNVNPSPPPPPPRRDFSRPNLLANQNNPNFYRPVSCSYLDSYQGFYNQQRNNASPNLNGNSSVMSFKPVNLTPTSNVREYYEGQTQSQISGTNNGNYYYDQDQVDSASSIVGNGNTNNNNFLAPSPYQKQLNLLRSPSEPPEIKVQYARASPIKRNAATPSPSPYNHNKIQHDSFANLRDPNMLRESPLAQQPVITSKLGFPVRRLQEANKIPSAQSPVHMRASEFWRKKEAEVTGNPVQPNPNHKRYMNRIRSADSSPLPMHRMRNSPVIQNSNESISSLSSFSAEAASPHMFNNNVKSIPGQRMGRLTPTGHNLANSPGNNSGHNSGGNHPAQNTGQNTGNNSAHNNGSNQGSNNGGGGNNPGQSSGGGGGDYPGHNNNGRNNPGQNPGLPSKSSREKTPSQLSACERLKVRTPSAPSICSDAREESHKIRSLVELNNGKTPGRNLEDALNELEDMYKSLRLSDEDLLDRAERRDLPTPHQELRNAPLIPLPQSYQQQNQAFRFEPLGSVESLATGSSSGSGTNYSGDNPNRVRAPPLRRSSRPDTVTDDMARRRCDSRETKPLDPRNVVAQSGSYMVFSPAFSPPVSPCPPETLPLSIIPLGQDEPDLTLDDVTFRNYKKANSIRIIDPQPPFGIPLGPITAAPGTDYLHSKKSDRLRPLFKPTKNPDLVNDDIAFRNLRKDLNSDSSLSKDWTPRLFSPTRDTNVFTYNDEPEQKHKKLRAIRSLSANITNFIPFTEYSFNSADNIGKWNSFTDLHHRNSNSSPFSQPQPQEKRRASTYLQPSWVEQIEKVQTSTETLTENRNSNNKFFSEPEHWDRKLPSKTVQLTPAIYDPTKPRRPWTDIILESFEKEKQNEIEQIAAANATANSNSTRNGDANDSTTTTTTTTQASSELRSHPANNLEVTEEDDDVFLDAREEPKSLSPEDLTRNAPNKSLTSTTSDDSMITGTVIDKESGERGTAAQTGAFPLLCGQNTRRGSWIEPSRSSSSYLSSRSNLNPSICEDDRRRKSWSDFPKDLLSSSRSAPGSSSEFPLASSASSPIIKKLFTPLPPPRKIKQINLEAFSASTKKEPIREVNCLKEVEGEKSTTTDTHAKNVQIPTSPIRGEEELNELMDMLIREADTCGPASSTTTENANITTTTTITTTRSDTSHIDNVEEEAEGVVGSKCSSSNEQVKPSISSSQTLAMTQKDTFDGRNTLKATTTTINSGIASLPKIPSKESQVYEPTRRKEKKILRWDEQENIVVAVVPEVVSVTRKPTRQLEDLNETEKNIVKDDDKKPTATSPTKTPATIETQSKSPSDPSSIEELIDSINESLPELEASCSASHKSHENESSLSSMGSLPSVPSPQPGSPTMITLPIRESPQPQYNLSKGESDRLKKSEVGDHDHLREKEEAIQQEMEVPPPPGPLDNINVTRTDDGPECEEKANELPQSGPTTTTTTTTTSNLGESHKGESSISCSRISPPGSNNKSNDNDVDTTAATPSSTTNSRGSGSSGEMMMVKKSPEVLGFREKTNERSVPKDGTDNKKGSDYSKESSPGYSFKAHLPFLRNSTTRSRSQSLISSVSTSPTTGSEIGESKREKDKSHKRKSHLNRAFTEERVPDSTSSFHLSPHTINHEPKSHELSSSDYTPSEARSRKSSTSIYKVPAIPSILTTHNNNDQSDGSPVLKNVEDNTIRSSQLPPSPTMKPKSCNILGKMQTYESRKSSPVVKRDSFSDAEGVSFIKKLLQKESMAEKTPNTTTTTTSSSNATELMDQSSLPRPIPKESGFMLKKSPSAGSNSYWSKFSNSQPAFLKKFFEKPDKSAKEPSEPETQTLTQSQVMASTAAPTPVHGGEKQEEPLLGFSVAQKASFFMKLEHEQRFSKWRKNSLEGPSITTPSPSQQVRATPEPTKSRSSRQRTQPVTTSEVQLAANIISEESKTNDCSPAISIPIRLLPSPAKLYESEDDLLPDEDEDIQAGANLSSYTECDESRPAKSGLEPSKLSLKDRVHMFDKIIATGAKAPSAAPTPYPATGGRETAPAMGFPVYHSSSAVISSSSRISAVPPINFFATNQITYNANFPVNINNAEADTTNLNPDTGFFRRRGSASDVELSTTPKYSPVMSRNSKTKSMFVADDVSEDGEVSSGGQEVAEIISRSYENSPLVRKKSWKSQKQAQASFTKEIWRRCKVNDNWSSSQENSRKPQPTQPGYKVTAKVTHQVANSQQIIYHQPQQHEIPPQPQPCTAASPPATSNLLQILTVLSSSNDELNETKPKHNGKTKGTSLGRSSTGSCASIPENACNFKSVAGQINIPIPDDESFHSFFDNRSSSAFTLSTSASSNATFSSANHKGGISASSDIQSLESLDMNSVQRESELLVMRKNLPLMRRKSNGKSRNPLKALAARIDLRNQWHTDVGDAPKEVSSNEDELF